jgi:Flp pilus assembly protein TadG
MENFASIVNYVMTIERDKSLRQHTAGQSMVEFALILPLMVLIVLGIFELGRAFFAYIAISNAAREGVRMYTFNPETTTYEKIQQTVRDEIGNSTVVDAGRTSIAVDCGVSFTIHVTSTAVLATCPTEEPVRVTVTYAHNLILGMLFSQPITIGRSAEMMKP